MEIQEFSVRGDYYIMRINEDGRVYQSTGNYYPFFKKHSKYGFDDELAFILAVRAETINVDKLIADYNRAQGYLKKIARERIEELENEVAIKQPLLSKKERVETAYKMYCEEVDKWVVDWKRLSEMNEPEINKLRRKKRLSKSTLVGLLGDSNLNGLSLGDFNQFKTQYSYEQFRVSKTKWLDCPFIDGHIAKVKNGAVLSFNPNTRKGIVFDVIDLCEHLYGITKFKILQSMNCSVQDFERWHIEAKRFEKAIQRIGYLRQRVDYPYMNKLLKEIWSFYEAFLNNAKGLIGTDYFLNGKAVFFRSLRTIKDDMIKSGGNDTVKRVADRINLLCAVGLLEKVKMEDLPEQLKYENGKVYDCNYFVLPDWDIKEIERRSSLLVHNGVRIGKANKERVAQILGDEIASKVYNEVKDFIVALENIPF